MKSKKSASWYRRAGAIIPACLLLALILLFCPLLPESLVLSSEKRVLFEQPIESTTCAVRFRHSVNKGLIEEQYRIDKDTCRLTLETSYNQSFGAGMLDTVETTQALNFRKEGDYYVMDFPPVWQQEINYIAGPIAGHIFVYGETSISLGELQPRKPFTISVKKRSIYKRLLKAL